MIPGKPHMHTRKLQISGGSTYIVSLPKAWVKDQKLNAGDDISIIRNSNNSLTFMPDPAESKMLDQAITVISPKDSEESIRRRIIAIYLAGYKSITIRSRGIRLHPSQTGAIRNLIRTSMIGTEIVKTDSESVVVQILTRLSELSFDVALRRMYLMTVNIHREAVSAFIENDKACAEEIIRTDDEVDRFTLYIQRNLIMAVQDAGMLQEMSLDGPADCLIYRTIISRIERIADHGVLIAKRVRYTSEPIDAQTGKMITELSEDALGIFERAIKALIKHDYQGAERILDDVPEIIGKQEEMMASMDSTADGTMIKFILDDIRRTAEYSGDIAEVVMDRNIQSVIIEDHSPETA